MSQVFISYKGNEESWASRLAETLEDFGISVWRDHSTTSGLRPGDQWLPELEHAIKESDSMIVMWSQALKGDAASVAHQEIGTMYNLIKAGGKQRFIPIFLDDASSDKYLPLAPYQADVSLKELYARHGPGGTAEVNPAEWHTAVLRLLQVFDVRDVVEVPYMIGAMTHEQADQLVSDSGQWAQEVQAYEAVRALRAKTVALDPGQYGDSPDDWRPFSNPPALASMRIADLIQEYDQAKRHHVINTGGKQKWVLTSYSADFVSTDPERRKRAREALHGKCMVVLDPLSMLHKTVYQTIVSNWGLQGRENVFVIGLAPCHFQMHADFAQTLPQLLVQMKGLLSGIYDRFAQPFEPEDQCVLEVGHESQFARWIQVAADAIIAAGKSPLKAGTISSSFRKRVRSTAPDAPRAGLLVMGSQGPNT